MSAPPTPPHALDHLPSRQRDFWDSPWLARVGLTALAVLLMLLLLWLWRAKDTYLGAAAA